MLKFAVHKGKGLNFTAGTAKSIEIMELEALASDKMMIPEDIMAFIATLQAADDFWVDNHTHFLICNEAMARIVTELSHARAIRFRQLGSGSKPFAGEAAWSRAERSRAEPWQH